MDGVIVTPSMKVGIVGIILGLILVFALPSWALWAGVAVIAIALAVPVAGYLALDKSQRRRLKAIRARRER